jgi:hypothetical protein
MRERGPVKGSKVNIVYDVYVDEEIGSQPTNIQGTLVHRSDMGGDPRDMSFFSGSEVEEGVVKANGQYYAFLSYGEAQYSNKIYTINANRVVSGKSVKEALNKLNDADFRDQIRSTRG